MSDVSIPDDQIVSARWRAESAEWEAKMRDEREQAAAEITRLHSDLAAAQERAERMKAAGLLALKVAESWIHDQCDGTDALEPALAELNEARATLQETTHD